MIILSILATVTKSYLIATKNTVPCLILFIIKIKLGIYDSHELLPISKNVEADIRRITD